MFARCFIFPALKSLGYEAGFSISNPGASAGPLDLHITHYRDGAAVGHRRLAIPSECLQFRAWQSDWGSELQLCGSRDLFAVRILAHGSDDEPAGLGELEGQMLFRHPHGWTSSLLSGFVPLRSAGHKFAPIIHTGHYFADRPDFASHTMLSNIRSGDDGPDAGSFAIMVQRRDGSELGRVHRQVDANAVLFVALDDVLAECGVGAASPGEGFCLTFVGGRSQFSIMTVFQRRDNHAIGLEHSLAPLYFIPQLRNPAVRSKVYGRIGART